MINLWKASTLGLVGTFALGIATGGGIALADAQPHMHEALDTLKMARGQLDKANADKGGHRAKAIQLTDQAIAETKAGIDYDNTHGGDKKDAEDPATAIEAR